MSGQWMAQREGAVDNARQVGGFLQECSESPVSHYTLYMGGDVALGLGGECVCIPD